MNPRPHSTKLRGDDIVQNTDGVLAMRNDEDSFWQSRMTVAGRRAELPNLVSLRQLARNIRAATILDAAIAGPTIADLIAADAIPGIPHAALTPTAPLETPARGSDQQGMDRSPVAAAHEARRWVHSHDGCGHLESPCRYAESQAAKDVSESTFLGIPIRTNPFIPADTFFVGQIPTVTVHRA